MKHLILSSALLALAATTTQAAPIGDAAAGKDKSVVCAGCHGADGNSPSAMYPKLGGQYPSYLLQALKEYKEGGRKNPIMAGFVAGLTETDMEDLAAWFASQTPVLGVMPR